ncbi:Cytochrome c1 heme lyase [Quaeritorhiza haematococci]|nr:Cytochrome c1 heme lyase [Quaeritorhiza haematococci]
MTAPPPTSACPVNHDAGSNASQLPPNHPPIPTQSPFAPSSGESSSVAESCPYSADRQAQELNPANNMPPPNQLPAPDQRSPLSTEREKSTIPMGGKFEGNVWVYPSEQMFYNAMKRKNWSPHERDMHVVVPIHNMVNEQCWKKILEWERMHDSSPCGGPKLLKFQGRPTDYTIKARIRQFLGYTLPFDRHDWTVDRCGKQVRYIIDFYSGARPTPTGGAPGQKQQTVAMFLDVRPAPTWEGMKERFMKFWKDGDGLW